MLADDQAYAHAARVALEIRLAGVEPDQLPAVLAEPEVRDLIEQALMAAPAPPAGLEDGR